MPLPPGVQITVSQLHDALTYSDAQLNRASHRLQSHYASVYAVSPSHTNVYTVVARVRALHAELSSLRESVRQIHHQKAHFIAKCRNHVQEQIRLLQAVHHPSFSQHGNASLPELHQLESIDAHLAQLQNNLDDANAAYFDAFDEKHPTDSRPLHTAQTKALSPTSTQAPTASDILHPSEPNHVEKPNAVTIPVDKPDIPMSEPTTPTAVFKPITKTAFNRLPRNLKVNAGKLDDVNEFYKKVLDVFAEKNGRPLSEKQLLHATGETTAQKLQTLRGLTVLRRNKDDKWLLPTSK